MNDWDKLMDPARAALEALIAKGDEMADRIEELEANLAKAVELLRRHCDPMDMSDADVATLAEIEGSNAS
jgi:predicted ATP-dependent protease